MKENIKILSYIGFAFLVSFGMLFSYLVMYEEGYLIKLQTQENDVDQRNKIFLLGTSYVDAVNTDHVQNVLNDNGMNVVVEFHHEKIPSILGKIDDFILKKPNLIVYGVGFSELGLTGPRGCTDSKIIKYSINWGKFK